MNKKEKKYDLLKLENQLCFPLYAASRLMTKIYKNFLNELEITYPQYLVLMVLWEKDGLSVSEVGNKLLLNTNTMTPLLKRLEHIKLISKKKENADERIIKIYLTEKGKLLKDDALKVPVGMFDEIGYSQESIIMLKKELETLIQKMKTIV